MPYNGDKPHRDILWAALNIIKKRGLSFSRLADDINFALENNSIPGVSRRFKNISRQVIEKYHKLGFDEQHSKGFNSECVALIFNYIENSEKYSSPVLNSAKLNPAGIPDANFFLSVSNYFKHPNTKNYARLSCLIGDYAMFRPAWTSNIDGLFLRSIVSISSVGDVLIYSESQNYQDMYSQISVDEHDNGFLFESDDNLFVISKESRGSCIKFATIYGTSCALHEKNKVDIFKGNMMALSGGLMSPGISFICRRIKDDPPDETSRLIDCSEFDQLTLDYFGIKNGHKRKRRERP